MSLGYSEQSISILEELYPQLRKMKPFGAGNFKKFIEEIKSNIKNIKNTKFSGYAERLEKKLASKKKKGSHELHDFILYSNFISYPFSQVKYRSNISFIEEWK